MKIKAKLFTLIVCLLHSIALLKAQQLVEIIPSSTDTIFADQYLKSPSLPYIILIHKKNASRGEFKNLAENFHNLDYNCIVPDLAYGGKYNYVDNLSVAERSSDYVSADQLLSDIDAVINFVWNKYNQKCLLLGSVEGASLALMAARKNKKVRGVIALSPGEYFLPELKIEDHLKPYDKPVFLAASKSDVGYLEPIIKCIPKNLMLQSVHQFNDNAKGAELIQNDQQASKNVWMDLLIFFSKIKNGEIYLN